MRPVLILALAAAAAALLAGAARPAGEAYPGRNGLIAFTSERNGLGPSIYTMHTDGTGLRQLTGGAAPDTAVPAVSPDGRTVAFARRREDGARHEVWLAAANGTRLRPLLHNAGAMSTTNPDWSPDGRWIAFEGGPDLDVQPRIYVVRPDGSGRRNLIDGGNPAWSPDGRRIAFSRGDGIWTIGADGRGLRRLHGGSAPAWSPDGRRLAFLDGVRGEDTVQVFVMDANGTHAHQVAKNRSSPDDDVAEEAGPPAWSPGGKLIAFAECCLGYPDEDTIATLDLVRPDGSGRRILAKDTYESGGLRDPAWMPDGRRIVAVSDDVGLVVINADDSGRRPFFAGGGAASGNPQWAPDGRRLFFNSGVHTWVMNANGGNRRTIADDLSPYSWSPNGKKIVGEPFEVDAIDVLDVASGRSHHILADEGAGDTTKELPSWSPKGPIAYLDDYVLWLYTFGRHPPTRSLGVEAEGGLAWSPDGRLLAYEWHGSIWIYDTKTKGVRLLIRNASEAAFSPNGRRIAYVRNVTRTNTEIFVARSDGSGERKLTANSGADTGPSWQPMQ